MLSYTETELGGACLPPQLHQLQGGRQPQDDHKFKVILGYLRELETRLGYKNGKVEGGRGEKKEERREDGRDGGGGPRRDRVADT